MIFSTDALPLKKDSLTFPLLSSLLEVDQQPHGLSSQKTVPTTDQDDDFVRLLTEHQSSLKAFIISRMPGLTGVNDVLQETNLTLWRKRADFRAGSNFTAWAFAVARFSVLEHCRKARATEQLVFSDALVDSLAYVPEDISPEQSDARSQALRHCLGKLTDKHQELIRLRYASEVTIEDFARSHGKSAGSLRVILFQIRSNLRNCINFQLRKAGTLE